MWYSRKILRANMTSLLVLVSWISFLHYIRMFESFRELVQLISVPMYEIRNFFLVLIFVMLSVTNAQFAREKMINAFSRSEDIFNHDRYQSEDLWYWE